MKRYINIRSCLSQILQKRILLRLEKYCVAHQKRFWYLPLHLRPVNVKTLSILQTTYRTYFIENLILNIIPYLCFCRRISYFKDIIEKPKRCHNRGEAYQLGVGTFRSCIATSINCQLRKNQLTIIFSSIFANFRVL